MINSSSDPPDASSSQRSVEDKEPVAGDELSKEPPPSDYPRTSGSNDDEDNADEGDRPSRAKRDARRQPLKADRGLALATLLPTECDDVLHKESEGALSLQHLHWNGFIAGLVESHPGVLSGDSAERISTATLRRAADWLKKARLSLYTSRCQRRRKAEGGGRSSPMAW